MQTPKIFESEYRFCEILWENEPVTSSELVRLCREKLDWKKSTTYTVIRRLSERGVLKNENSIVTALVSKADVQSAESEERVNRAAAKLYSCIHKKAKPHRRGNKRNPAAHKRP